MDWSPLTHDQLQVEIWWTVGKFLIIKGSGQLVTYAFIASICVARGGGSELGKKQGIREGCLLLFECLFAYAHSSELILQLGFLVETGACKAPVWWYVSMNLSWQGII